MADEESTTADTDKPNKRLKMCKSEAEVNPLLIDLVLEKVFPYCKSSQEENWLFGSDYRLVCKVWDRELVKLIRRDSEIQLTRLITPYPDGLGWTENQEKDGGFCYECPYVVAPFENIAVTCASCDCKIIEDSRAIRWFQIMGRSVKRLCYTAPLTCYHQVRFLECILKLWCPNLKALRLNKVKSIYTLLHNSKFVDPFDLVCDLKEITLTLVEENDDCESMEEFKNCQDLAELCGGYLNFSDTPPVLQAPEDTKFPPFGLTTLKRLSKDFQADLSQESLDFIRKITGNDGGGGVLGQILKNADIEKLVITRLTTRQYPDFLGFLNFRQIKMKNTLKHFDFDDFPMALNSTNMAAFRLLKFPLVTIRFGMLFACQIRNKLRELLASYSETLEHLEFSGDVRIQDWEAEQEEEYIEIDIPLLPKLKTFVNENIFTCRLGGLDFLKKTPNLEKCALTNTIYHSSIYPLTPAEVFNMLFQACHFESSHPLKELILDGKLTYNNHLDLMQTWFPQLRKVEVTLDGTDVFVDFLRMAKQLKLEDVKISFRANDNEWSNTGIANNVGKMACLKYLQLIHLSDSPITILATTCEEGFAKAPKLTSLKLTNFGMFADEVNRIKTCLSHISCVKFSQTILQYKPVNVEFSVGVEKSFPFAI